MEEHPQSQRICNILAISTVTFAVDGKRIFETRVEGYVKLTGKCRVNMARRSI
jgi:hypothetical protein